MAASRIGMLDGFAYQSPPPSYWSRAPVRRGVRAAVSATVSEAASTSAMEIRKGDRRVVMHLKVAVAAGGTCPFNLLPAQADRRRSARSPVRRRVPVRHLAR